MSLPLVPSTQTRPEVPIPRSAAGQRHQFAEAYAVLEQAVGQQAFPGAAFSVLAGKEIVALDGVGRFTYQQDSRPVTASTVYDLASVTKVLATTSMAMLLYQRRLLDLDQSITFWLPGFAQNEPPESPRRAVTVRMLLAHASGLPGYARLFETCPDGESLFNACITLPLEAAPGTRAEYSDPGFIVLGRILERIAGESIDRFCAREIFTPLGMTSTRFLPPASWAPSIPPTEEDLHFRHRIIQGEVQDENCFMLGGVSGHAGLFSNALDPLLYTQCLFGQMSQQIFLPETLRIFTRRAELPPGTSRALGWDTPSQPSSSGRFFSNWSAGHLGYAGTSLWIDFAREEAIVLLTNRTWPHRDGNTIRRVRPLFHDAIAKAVGLGG